eukprot:2735834-Heterocapsa_arctica.AAC.1
MGRSSSYMLNGVLRGSMGWQIFGRKALANFWVCSGSNTADDPSRSKVVRRPAPCPAWLAKHILEQPSADQQAKH